MWWFLIPVAAIGKIIYDVVTDDSVPTPTRTKSTLELNLERLRNELRRHDGIKVAIIGQPGAGKSSLLKKMTRNKVVPLPVIGTQTDATDWSSDRDCNLLSLYQHYAFADVPGYDTSSHPAEVFESAFPFEDFDAFIVVLHGKLHRADEAIFWRARITGKPVCIARSFLDGLDSDEVAAAEYDLRARLNADGSIPVVFFSNRNGSGIEEIINTVRMT